MTSPTKHQEQLAGIAKWCLSQYRGILTPTGRPKKPPTFYILKCDLGHLTLSSTKTAKATRFLCSEVSLSSDKTKSTSAPRTLKCEREATTIEEIHNDQ